MPRVRLLVLFVGAATTILLGALTGGGSDDEPVAPTTTATTALPVPADSCTAGAPCAARDVGGPTKTAVVLTAVAGGVALVWCRRRAKQLLAAS